MFWVFHVWKQEWSNIVSGFCLGNFYGCYHRQRQWNVHWFLPPEHVVRVLPVCIRIAVLSAFWTGFLKISNKHSLIVLLGCVFRLWAFEQVLGCCKKVENPTTSHPVGGGGEIPLKGGFDQFWILSSVLYYLRVAVIILTFCRRCLKSKILLKTPTFRTHKS